MCSLFVFLFGRSADVSSGSGNVIDINDESLSVHSGKSSHKKWFKAGHCKGIWRPEKLVGRCFGLKPFYEIPELKRIKQVTNAGDCKALCCNLGTKCATWQFQAPGDCQLGGTVRLGFEGANTVDWCEPHAPAKWNGRYLASRNVESDRKVCTWAEELPNQCFGLGPERLSAKKTSLNTEECAQACCDDSECGMWQEIPGRGCYFNKRGGWCDVPRTAYDGGRKCIKNFCGGMEEQILGTMYHTTVRA